VGRHVTCEVGQTLYPVNRGRVEMEGEGDKVTKRRRGKEGLEQEGRAVIGL